MLFSLFWSFLLPIWRASFLLDMSFNGLWISFAVLMFVVDLLWYLFSSFIAGQWCFWVPLSSIYFIGFVLSVGYFFLLLAEYQVGV